MLTMENLALWHRVRTHQKSRGSMRYVVGGVLLATILCMVYCTDWQIGLVYGSRISGLFQTQVFLAMVGCVVILRFLPHKEITWAGVLVALMITGGIGMRSESVGTMQVIWLATVMSVCRVSYLAYGRTRGREWFENHSIKRLDHWLRFGNTEMIQYVLEDLEEQAVELHMDKLLLPICWADHLVGGSRQELLVDALLHQEVVWQEIPKLYEQLKSCKGYSARVYWEHLAMKLKSE
ncbi:MAG: hypothetical protein ACRCW2_06535 [Cellulosilyticaceae bacterium]